MRITREQTQDNRSRIVAAAADLFRQRGFGGVAVAELTKAAGLTHGGFYNHFESKDALAAEACRSACASAVARMRSFTAVDSEGRPVRDLADYVEQYLSSANRDAPFLVCPMATLSIDVARAGGAVQAAFAEGFAAYAAAMGEAVAIRRGRPCDDADSAARGRMIIATLSGALNLARAIAVADRGLSDVLLADGRSQALALL